MQQRSDERSLAMFNLKDMIKIVGGVCKITQSMSESDSVNGYNGNLLTLHSLLRYWVYLSDKIYSQKLGNQKKGFLFYLINNVLM